MTVLTLDEFDVLRDLSEEEHDDMTLSAGVSDDFPTLTWNTADERGIRWPCIAVHVHVLPEVFMFRLGAALARAATPHVGSPDERPVLPPRSVEALIRGVRSHRMGRNGTVLYWPEVRVEG